MLAIRNFTHDLTFKTGSSLTLRTWEGVQERDSKIEKYVDWVEVWSMAGIDKTEEKDT
jgi:hypothetical protein